MKMAVAATGCERLKWVRLALAWHDLALGQSRFALPKASLVPAGARPGS